MLDNIARWSRDDISYNHIIRTICDYDRWKAMITKVCIRHGTPWREWWWIVFNVINISISRSIVIVVVLVVVVAVVEVVIISSINKLH